MWRTASTGSWVELGSGLVWPAASRLLWCPALPGLLLSEAVYRDEFEWGAECEVAEPVEGALRLRGGSGSPCDPVYTGFTEIFHSGAWGAVCNSFEADPSADVVCRQLGFPYATPVDSFIARPEPDYGNFDSPPFPRFAEEAEEESEIFWLRGVQCGGLEEELSECDLGSGFRAVSGCDQDRLHVACRKFAVEAALEAEVTPGAGVLPRVCVNRMYLSLPYDMLAPGQVCFCVCALAACTCGCHIGGDSVDVLRWSDGLRASLPL